MRVNVLAYLFQPKPFPMTMKQQNQYYSKGKEEEREDFTDLDVQRVWKSFQGNVAMVNSAQLTDEMMGKLDYQFTNSFVENEEPKVDTKLLAGTRHKICDSYFKAYREGIARVVNDFATETWVDAEETLVADNILPKLKWITHNHLTRIRWPLLTKSLVLSIAEVLAFVPLSLREVSRRRCSVFYKCAARVCSNGALIRQ